jgi:hypothetical protein
MYNWVHVVNFLILVAYVAAFVMLIVCTVSLVKILRVLKARKGQGIQVIPDGGDESGFAGGFAGVDPQVVAAIAAAVTVMGQSEGKRLVVRSVRRSDGWADAGRRESVY